MGDPYQVSWVTHTGDAILPGRGGEGFSRLRKSGGRLKFVLEGTHSRPERIVAVPASVSQGA